MPAWQELGERLERRGRLGWAMEDSADLLEPALYRADIDNAVERVKGARNLRGRARRAAVGLARWREQQAETKDRPRQWILRDAVLLQIAGNDPTSRQQLANIPALPESTVRRAADELLDILREARVSTDDYEPPARPGEAEKALLKDMQHAVQRCADELGIAAEVLAPRKDLASALSGARNSRVFRGWRRQLVGEELLRMLP
ncbi:MAG TPA: HRDC domain-containing protein [Woeseiaceae bacterium]|nr:HRDC domain-containing protein [Woeseiaceae bacterium]